MSTRYEHLAWAQTELNSARRWTVQAEALLPRHGRPGNPGRSRYFADQAEACLAERLPARCDQFTHSGPLGAREPETEDA